MDIKHIENLLEKTEIIKKKYDDLAEYTGENFNVFNILRLDEKELMHSAFIANLLNVNGKHGQKDVRSEEHTSELQSRPHLVYRLLLEKKKKKNKKMHTISNNIYQYK